MEHQQLKCLVILAFVWSVFLSCATCKSDLASVLDEGEKCAQTIDLWPCLKRGGAKAVGVMLSYQGDIPLIGPYLTVVPDRGHVHDEGRAHPNNRSLSVYSKILEFAEKRMLRVSLPMNFVTWLVGATTSSEGRGKKDKGSGVLMLGGMMMMTTLMSTAFGALALMAAKGLMTSILALLLSAMAVAKKSGGHGHARTSYEVINSPHAYHQVSDFKLENAAVSDVSPPIQQYNSAQTEPIQYGNQQYD